MEKHKISNANHIEKKSCYSPASNIIERNDDFILELALPGREKKDLVIDIDQKNLKISSITETQLPGDEVILRSEFQYGPFERTFLLPDSIDSEKIEAVYKNGVLKITIPKKETAKTKPAREIAIA